MNKKYWQNLLFLNLLTITYSQLFGNHSQIHLNSQYKNFLSKLNFNSNLTEEENLSVRFSEILKKMFNNAMDKATNISSLCRESMNYAIKDEEYRYIKKLFRDSAKNKNDLGSFIDCTTLDYIDNDKDNNLSISHEMTYLIIIVKPSESESLNNSLLYNFRDGYVFGVCIRKNCTDDEYKILLKEFNKQAGDFMFLDNREIEITNTEYYISKRYTVEFFVSLIPFYILLFLIIISFYPKLLVWIFKPFFFNKKIQDNQSKEIIDLKDDDNFNKSVYLKADNAIQEQSLNSNQSIRKNSLIYCFKKSINVEELFCIKTETNNDSGLYFIRGLRGLSLIYLLIGIVYLNILGSPLKIYCPIQHRNLMISPMFNIIVIGTRLSPKFLFSISGFILCYKFICFMEDKTEAEKLNNNQSVWKSQISKDNKNLSSFGFTKLTSNDQSMIKIEKVINFKIYLYFIFSQLYKVIFYVFSIFFFYFSFYPISALIYDPNPIWMYFKKNVIKTVSLWRLINQIFMFNFFHKESDINIFWIVQNEIFLFITVSLIIFIFYRNNWRLDIFFILSIVLLFVLKILLFSIVFSDPKLLIISGTENFKNITSNVANNIIYYLIGCYFGLVNYIVQKSISRNYILNNNKDLLKIPMKFVEFFQYKYIAKLSIIGIFTLLFFIFDSLSYALFPNYIIDKDPNSKEINFISAFLNLFFMIDIELLITLIYVCMMGLSLTGENLLIPFMSQEFWLFFSRPYFTNVLLIYFSTIHILYHTESRIKLEIFNIIFYSLFSFCIHILLTCFMYVIIEVPYKRLNKILLRRLIS